MPHSNQWMTAKAALSVSRSLTLHLTHVVRQDNRQQMTTTTTVAATTITIPAMNRRRVSDMDRSRSKYEVRDGFTASDSIPIQQVLKVALCAV